MPYLHNNAGGYLSEILPTTGANTEIVAGQIARIAPLIAMLSPIRVTRRNGKATNALACIAKEQTEFKEASDMTRSA